MLPERVGRVLLPAAVALTAAVLAAPLVVPPRTVKIDPSVMKPLDGAAYRVHAGFGRGALSSCEADSIGWQTVSLLVVTEDGRRLGPAHLELVEIQRYGGGGYVHFMGSLYFSSSDGTDPRTNGRRYTASCRPTPRPGVALAVGALDLLALALFPALAGALLRRTWPWALLAAGAAARGAAVAWAAGPKNAALALAVAQHAALGAALALVVLGAGAGVLLALRGRRPLPLADAVIFGYPVGLALIGAAGVAAVVLPAGRLVAAAALALAIVPLVRAVSRETAAELGRTLARALPACLLLGVVAGLLWHGPTASLAGAPIGDATMFVGRAASVEKQLFPLPNLGAEGELQGYGNQLPGLVAALFARVPGFDPFLFFAASGPVFLLLSLVVCLALVAPAGPPVLVAALFAAAVPYPSWTVAAAASPYLYPLVFSVFLLYRRGHEGAAATAALAGSALSKVASAPVLLPAAALSFAARALRGRSRWLLGALAIGGAAAAAYAAYMLRAYVPIFRRIAPFGPESWQWWHVWHARDPLLLLPVAARDAGLIALAVVALRLRPAIAACVWIGVAAHLVFPFLFHTAATAAVLLAAVAWLDEPERLPRPRVLAGVAALLLLAPVLRDPGGIAAGAAWLGCVVAATAAAQAVWRRAAAAALAVTLAAVAAGVPMVDSGGARIFTPELRDIWSAVRERTPEDAIVFTDQTGATPSRVGGWNDYATVAERQFFLATWAMSRLRHDPAGLAKRLAENEAVLSGELRPADAPLSRAYPAAYAVVRADRAMPARFERVYRNARYALWRIPP